jgi:hypothetical protein
VDVVAWEGGPMGRYLRLRYLGEDSEAGADQMHGGRAADSG